MDVQSEDFLLDNSSADARMDALLKRSTEAMLIVAHGTHGGKRCNGADAKYIAVRCRAKHLWLHSCQCANVLAPELAGKGYATYSFKTNVLTTTEDRAELAAVHSVLSSAQVGTPASQVRRTVQEGWHNEATKLLMSSTPDVIRASVLTHLELSLRSFEPTPQDEPRPQ